MEINLTLCNFSKFINFITSIDGDLNGASIEYIVDAMWDDTWDNNEDRLVNSMEGGIADMLEIVKAAMQKKRGSVSIMTLKIQAAGNICICMKGD